MPQLSRTGSRNITSFGRGKGFVFQATIAADVNNYNLRTAAVAAGWNGVLPLVARVTINSSVVVGSANTASYAFDTGTTAYPTGSRLFLTVNGYIIGAGGNGASGNGAANLRPGDPAGPALRVNHGTFLTNNNIIGGGGGGSGREGYGGSNGGAGAGGAGRIAGVSVGSGATTAKNGSLLVGGTTGYGVINGRTTQPDPNQYATWGSTLGQDGNVGGYGGLGGTGGNAIVGTSNITYVVTGRIHGRTVA